MLKSASFAINTMFLLVQHILTFGKPPFSVEIFSNFLNIKGNHRKSPEITLKSLISEISKKSIFGFLFNTFFKVCITH